MFISAMMVDKAGRKDLSSMGPDGLIDDLADKKQS